MDIDRSWWGMLRQSSADFWKNDCMGMAGAIAHSTLVSLPALAHADRAGLLAGT